MIVICITALSGQYSNIKSYRDGITSKIIIIGYTRILFSFLLGYFVFSDTPDIFTVIGVLIIIICGIYVFLREHKQNINSSKIMRE